MLAVMASPSHGLLLYSSNDWSNMRRWARAEEYSLPFLERVYHAIAVQLGIEDPPQEPVEAEENSAAASLRGLCAAFR